MMEGKQALEVVVVGGSIAGLMAGVRFKRAGHNVTILEQSPLSERSGSAAGIALRGHAKDFMEANDRLKHIPLALPTRVVKLMNMATMTTKRDLNIPMLGTSWEAMYHRLRANFDAMKSDYCPDPPSSGDGDGRTVFHTAHKVLDVTLTPDKKLCVTAHDSRAGADTILFPDLVIAADGLNSSLRQKFQPSVQRQMPGYCSWRGVVPTSHLSPEFREKFEGYSSALTIKGSYSYVIMYAVPGDRGSLTPGERYINMIWYYRYSSPTELNDILTSTDGHTHRTTLPKGKMRPEIWARQKAIAKDIFHPLAYEIVDKITEPFVSVVSNLCSKQAAFLDNRLFFVGDALIQAQPNSAQASNLAAFEVTTLVEAVEKARALERKEDKDMVFRDWERTVLAHGDVVRQLSVLYGWNMCGWGGTIALALKYFACLIKWSCMRWWWALLRLSSSPSRTTR